MTAFGGGGKGRSENATIRVVASAGQQVWGRGEIRRLGFTLVAQYRGKRVELNRR